MNYITVLEWADTIWNPVTGCYNGCEGCRPNKYVKKVPGMDGARARHDVMTVGTCVTNARGRVSPFPYGFMPTFFQYRLRDLKWVKGRNILVCSMGDLFAEWIPNEWIEKVLKECRKKDRENIFLFLTKNPARYDELRDILQDGERYWYGEKLTGPGEHRPFLSGGNYKRFLYVRMSHSKELPLDDLDGIDWVVAGAVNGENAPGRTEVLKFFSVVKKSRVPMFMENSTREYFLTGKIPKEMPQELRKNSFKVRRKEG